MATPQLHVPGIVALVMFGFLPGQLATAPARAQCESAKLLASDGETQDLFGYSVAIDGDTAVVTNRTEDYFDPPTAYVFMRQGDQWTEVAGLRPPDIEQSDDLGLSVAVSGDTIIVTGWGTDAYPKGLAIVYRFDGAAWTEQARLTPDPNDPDLFHGTVAVAGDLAVVGGLGVAYVYRYDGANWVAEQKLTPPAGFAGGMGYSVDVDHGVIVASTRSDTADTGAVCIFEHDGAAWTCTQTLVSPHAAEQDEYGRSLAIAGDVLAVSARDWVDQEWAFFTYVYRHDGATWTFEQELTPGDPNMISLGGPVDIDGDLLVTLGLSAEHLPGVWTYQYDGAAWNHFTRLCPSDDPTAGLETFGYSIALSGQTALAGSPLDGQQAPAAGAAYAYELIGEDCNHNGVCDARDIAEGYSLDDNDNGVPWECDCPGDFNFDRYVDLADLSILLAHYQDTNAAYIDGDINFDGAVDLADLAELLAVYGNYCPPGRG